MTSLYAAPPAADPYEVVIAGGGVAALETLLALHALANGRVRTRLVAPNAEFRNPALSVAEPFGVVDPPSWDLASVARAHGAIAVDDTIAAVDGAARTVTTGSGDELSFDALVLATGARRVPALAGALTFSGPDDVRALAGVLREAEKGAIGSIAFAVPRGITWTLPAYELALLTATHLAARGIRDVEISVATPERSPLSLFGRRSSDMIAGLLRDAGIALRSAPPARVENGSLVLADGDLVAADRVVALPRLEALAIAGVPRAADGFIPTDLHGEVEGLPGVFAAGDATWYPVKQGGIAAQQADAVAAAVAARAGAPVVARSFRPVMRGALLTGTGVQYLRERPRSPEGDPSPNALWWPPAKIAGRYLGPYLAGDETNGGELEDLSSAHAGSERETAELAFEAADADAGWGDYGSALRWLSVAERLGLVLPSEYAAKREQWRDACAGLSVAHR
jgi:sulfide:quinone oxidoreductase